MNKKATSTPKITKSKKNKSYKVEKQKLLSEERKELLKKCMDKLSAKESTLKRIFGTLGMRRLKSILNGSYISKSWFTKRKYKTIFSTLINGTEITKKDLSYMKV